MNTTRKTCLACAMLLAAMTAHAEDRDTDPLQGLTRCFSGGEFHSNGTYRQSPSVVSRQVDTATGRMAVSIADGYRLMIYRNSTSPLVNLTLERSAAGQFNADRDAILKQLAALADGSRPPEQLRVERNMLHGIEVAAINKPAMEASGVVSMVQLFDAATGTIASVQLLNQQGPAREFNSETDYAALRDRFIGTLSACMARKF